MKLGIDSMSPEPHLHLHIHNEETFYPVIEFCEYREYDHIVIWFLKKRGVVNMSPNTKLHGKFLRQEIGGCLNEESDSILNKLFLISWCKEWIPSMTSNASLYSSAFATQFPIPKITI